MNNQKADPATADTLEKKEMIKQFSELLERKTKTKYDFIQVLLVMNDLVAATEGKEYLFKPDFMQSYEHLCYALERAGVKKTGSSHEMFDESFTAATEIFVITCQNPDALNMLTEMCGEIKDIITADGQIS